MPFCLKSRITKIYVEILFNTSHTPSMVEANSSGTNHSTLNNDHPSYPSCWWKQMRFCVQLQVASPWRLWQEITWLKALLVGGSTTKIKVELQICLMRNGRSSLNPSILRLIPNLIWWLSQRPEKRTLLERMVSSNSFGEGEHWSHRHQHLHFSLFFKQHWLCKLKLKYYNLNYNATSCNIMPTPHFKLTCPQRVKYHDPTMLSNVCLQDSLEFKSSRSKGQASSSLHPLRSSWPKRVPQRRCLVWCNCWRARWTWTNALMVKSDPRWNDVYGLLVLCLFWANAQCWKGWKKSWNTSNRIDHWFFIILNIYLHYLNVNKLSISRFCLIRRQCQIPIRRNVSGAVAEAQKHATKEKPNKRMDTCRSSNMFHCFTPPPTP